jgi:hypothetical protein
MVTCHYNGHCLTVWAFDYLLQWTDEFNEFFTQFGEVTEHQIMRDHSTNRSRGFGFITFDTEQAVDDLLARGNKLELAGTQVSRYQLISILLYHPLFTGF